MKYVDRIQHLGLAGFQLADLDRYGLADLKKMVVNYYANINILISTPKSIIEACPERALNV